MRVIVCLVALLCGCSSFAGAAVYVVDPMGATPILPATSVIPGAASSALELSAARGEYEPVSFVLRNEEGEYAGPISITASDLVGDGVIPLSAVDIKWVKAWYQSPGAWRVPHVDKNVNETEVLVPELLLNDPGLVHVDVSNKTNSLKLQDATGTRYQPISEREARTSGYIPSTSSYPVQDSATLQSVMIAANENQQVWVTVRVPEDAVSGDYTGTLTVSGENGVVEIVTLKVAVLPFTLDPPSLEYSMYYRGQLTNGVPTVSSEFKSQAQLTAELANMQAHGITTPSVYQSYKADVRELLNTYLSIRRSLGLSGPLYYMGRTLGSNVPANLATLDAAVPDLLSRASAYGLSDVYIYSLDEAKGQALIDQIPAMQHVQGLGGKILSAGHAGHFAAVGSGTNALAYHGALNVNESSEAHAVGSKIFSYHNPQSGVEDPSVYRRNYGIELWRAGYDGAMDYAYQHSFGNIWNDFDHATYRDHVFAYPTANGVIDTIAWEGFREAVDDVRYISTLENMVAAYVDDPELSYHIKAAQAYVLHLKEDGVENFVEFRREIAAQIARLYEAAHYCDE